MSRIYKIIDAQAWAAAQRDKTFQGAEIDRRDGYIHLSTAAQVRETARRHFAGVEDLILVAFEAESLGPALRWEPSRGGDLFPHVYGDIDPALALETAALSLNAEGWPDPGELSA